MEPTDVFHAAQLLARLLDMRRGRALERGRAYRALVEGQLYRHLCFWTAAELVRETLQVSQRTLQEDARLALELCPGLAEAIGHGLDLERALQCRRRTLRCDAHHIVFRSKGGPDDPDEDGLCVCRACHLRLVHTGRVRVDRVVLPQPQGRDTVGMLWTWPDRQVWVA